LKIIERCVAIILIILLFCFLFILATTHFDKHFFVSEWTGVVSAIGSTLAGVGTLIGVFVALYVGGQWRKQNKVTSFLVYYETLLKLIDCVIERGEIFTKRVIEDYPNSPQLKDYERSRWTHLDMVYNEFMSSIVNEYAKLDLLYKENEVAPLDILLLKEQIRKYTSVQYVYQPHEVDLAEYEENISREFNALKRIFIEYKDHLNMVVNKT
jgi:hypothetical protein